MAVLGTLEYLISIDSSKVSSGLNAAEGKVKGFGEKLPTWAVAKGQVLGGLITKAGQTTVSFVKDSISESMTFNKSMSQVAATLGKTTKEVQNLSDFAREMGAKTAFTADQAAQGLNYMALAGYDAETSMKMLPTVLNLAAAGNMELASASDMVTDAQSALGLSIEETETMVDQMAKTSSKTNTSVEQLGAAFLTVGGTAKKLKGGTAELSALLGVLANNGIKGAEGGTALRNVLNAISNPAGKAAKQLKRLKIDAYDKEGNLRSMTDILSDFSEKTKDMTDKKRTELFAKMFNVRDLKSVEALLSMTREDWETLTGEIENSQGAADKMAKTQLDNLAGDMTIFGSALSEAKLALVEGLTPGLRNLTKFGTRWLTDLTKNFKEKGLSGAIDTARRMFDSLARKMRRSENPVVKFLGQTLLAFRKGFTWQAFGSTITRGWNLIKDGFESLGSLVFGKNVDGTTKWPTWDTIKTFVSEKWEEIKTGFNELGKLVFGENVDGSIKWPTWEDIGDAVTQAWTAIKDGVKGLAKIAFGENVDGSIKWPEWKDIEKSVTTAWNKIVEEAGKLKGLVFGDSADAASIFATIVETMGEIRSEIEKGAINLGVWLFGEENADTVTSIVERVSNALVSLAAGFAAFEVTTGVTNFIEMFKKGGTLASIFGQGGTLATFFTQNKTGLIVGGIALAIAEIIQNWDKIEEAFAKIGDWVNTYIIPAFQVVGDFLNENIVKPIQDIIAEAKKLLGLDLPEPGASGSGGRLNKGEAENLKFGLDSITTDEFGNLNATGISDWLPTLRKSLESAEVPADEVETTLKDVQDHLSKGDIGYVKDLIDKLTETAEEAETAGGKLEEGMQKTELSANSAAESVGALGENINSLHDKTVTITTRYVTIGGGSNGNTGVPKAPPVGRGFVVNESRAKGDWNVGYDHIAMLHRGEMVLTKSQARKYREGNNGSIDLAGLAASIVAAVKEGMAGASVNSYLDGRSVTGRVNRRNTNRDKARRFVTA